MRRHSIYGRSRHKLWRVSICEISAKIGGSLIWAKLQGRGSFFLARPMGLRNWRWFTGVYAAFCLNNYQEHGGFRVAQASHRKILVKRRDAKGHRSGNTLQHADGARDKKDDDSQ